MSPKPTSQPLIIIKMAAMFIYQTQGYSRMIYPSNKKICHNES